MECQAITERKSLTTAIAYAIQPKTCMIRNTKAEKLLEPLGDSFGEEKGLAVIFSVLHGIVAEYLDGGDQIVELCTCGEHIPNEE